MGGYHSEVLQSLALFEDVCPEATPGLSGLEGLPDVLVLGGLLALVPPHLGVPDGDHAIRALDLRPLVVLLVMLPHQLQVVDLQVADAAGPRVKLLLMLVPLGPRLKLDLAIEIF